MNASRKVFFLEKGHYLQRHELWAPEELTSQLEARDPDLAKSYDQGRSLEILWREKCGRGAPPSPLDRRERTRSEAWEPLSGAQQPQRTPCCGRMEQSRDLGGTLRGRLGAVEAGKVSVARVVAP